MFHLCRILPFTFFSGIVIASAIVASATVNAQSPSETDAKTELNAGVASYKQAHYDEAIAHFRKATELAPDSIMAKTYLATALAQNVVPALDTPDNLKTAQDAIDVFHQVLAAQPHDINSLKQVAAIYYSIRRLDDARDWQKKVLAEDPNDPEAAAYTIGVINWTQAQQNALKALIAAGLQDDGEGNTAAPIEVRKGIRSQNTALVEEGLRYLQQALASRPDYDDAMAYLNLVYRRKADLDFDNPGARNDDVAVARDWAQKAMATRKARDEKRAAGPRSTQN
jgi:tetratricopeptide (TPR) repeat protein